MVDRYWRKIESVENDIENSILISSILLKLKGYDEKFSDLSKIGNNENIISSNLGKIDTNKNNISSDLEKIGNNENSISSNLGIINNTENDMNVKIKKDIYKKTFIISNMDSNSNKKIGDIYINSKFSTNGIIKINVNYIYNYDDSNNFSHLYKFYSNYQKFKEMQLDHNKTLNLINDKFNISGVNSKKINLLIYLINNNNNNSLVELYDYNTIQIIYNDNIDTSKIDMNTDNISSNLIKIDVNKENITSNLEKIDENKEDILLLKIVILNLFII